MEQHLSPIYTKEKICVLTDLSPVFTRTSQTVCRQLIFPLLRRDNILDMLSNIGYALAKYIARNITLKIIQNLPHPVFIEVHFATEKFLV